MTLPQDVEEKVQGRKLENIALRVEYENWQGQRAIRNIVPLESYYGHTEQHPQDQWLVKVGH